MFHVFVKGQQRIEILIEHESKQVSVFDAVPLLFADSEHLMIGEKEL